METLKETYQDLFQRMFDLLGERMKVCEFEWQLNTETHMQALRELPPTMMKIECGTSPKEVRAVILGYKVLTTDKIPAGEIRLVMVKKIQYVADNKNLAS